ncbi:hypothetical protein SETIT_4G127600v2 [Setaria italica]|uniref:Uncharacterized protein n=2 Tax=Setaria TaxID=4554 RepID=K3Y0N7_SETIT|nr:hypothetical protein SETIT_4G127600v2 [Setaria italica]TKW21016.1 hypothetical protein SEVIR_4G189500v2 [Setaria viridis]
MMPKIQASPKHIETYLNQERSKRQEMQQKFLEQCHKFQEAEERKHNSRTKKSAPLCCEVKIICDGKR